MGKCRSGLLKSNGQCKPKLDAMKRRATFLLFGRCPFRMNDAPARGHEIHRAGLNGLDIAQAVPMHDFAVEKPCYRGNADVRVRSNVHTFAHGKLHGPHMVRQNIRPNHPAAFGRQGPPNRKTSEVLFVRSDKEFNLVRSLLANRFVTRMPSH